MSKTFADIDAIREKAAVKLQSPADYRVVVGMATCGLAAGASFVEAAIKQKLDEIGLKNVDVETTGCIGMCRYEPIVEVSRAGEDKISYILMDPGKAVEMVESHLQNGKPLWKYTLRGLPHESRHPAASYKVLPSLEEIEDEALHFTLSPELEPKEPEPVSPNICDLPFYHGQKRIVLHNCGVINPESIDEYIGSGGYLALEKVIKEFSPADVVELIKASGLRGRGGAGFPTGVKWQFAHNEDSPVKYFICNGDEGDPGAFMDRSVMEGDPQAIVEAMIIAGYAIGAHQGYIYVRAEYPVAVERLRLAIRQAYEYGFLGDHVMGSDFAYHIDLRLGAGAFVCGEETALIASVEGQRGMSRNKPPFPAHKGLWGKPTVINNVETLANIPLIIRNGIDWYRGIGTEKSPGTKVFALGGKIANTGLVEVEMGTKLRDIIEKIGGGCPNNKKFKAVQTGGPSGGCITTDALDTPIDFDTLVAAGSMMGSGGMIVMDEDNCMVDIARFYLDFIVDESCGKCVPCREGTKRLLEILNRIAEGKGELQDLDLLEMLGNHLKETALCALGQTAPNPVLSTVKQFRDEYLAHIVDQHCPAHVCRNLLGYEITDNCCGCTKCMRLCPVHAISGVPKEKLHIDLGTCIRCGLCIQGCAFNAIVVR